MAKFFETIDEATRKFIGRQKIFFTASAPLDGDGHINLSPKGMDTFRILDERTICYLDLTGSGNETAAHVAENGRLTIMFCSFSGAPLILRLYGRGAVAHRETDEFEKLSALFEDFAGVRQIIVLNVEKLQTSCGFAVPEYEFQAEREKLVEWAENKGADGIEKYRREKNQTSIDGLPTGLFE